MNNDKAIAYKEDDLRRELSKDWKKWAGHIIHVGGAYRFSKGESYTRELTVNIAASNAIQAELGKPHDKAGATIAKSADKQAIAKRTALVHGRKTPEFRVKTNLPAEIDVNVYGIEALETVYADWLDAIKSESMPELAVHAYLDLHKKTREESKYANKSADEFASVWERRISQRWFETQLALSSLSEETGRLKQYYEQRNGKPRYQGVSSQDRNISVSMQTCQKTLRRTALAGQWSYDIECCHHVAMQHYARLAGIECPVLDTLVLDRKKFRRLLSAETGIPYADIKKALLIIVYGGRFGWAEKYDDDRENALTQLLGKDGQRALAGNDTFKLLRVELHRIFKFIVEHHKPEIGSRGGIQNAVGQFLRPAKDDTLKGSQIVAFILQGIETKAALAMIDASKTPAVLIHDGIVCTDKENPKTLEMAMFDATGISFKVEEKQIQSPEFLP